MYLTEDDVLRDMIFEMNGMRFYCVCYPFVEKRKKKEGKNTSYCLRGTSLYRAGPLLPTTCEPLIYNSVNIIK